MNISGIFIQRPVMTTLLTIALIIFGITAFLKMPVSNLPDINYPVITVTVQFPGTNPETMANTVATPLEKQFMSISGLRYVTSSNKLGSSTIVLEFDIDKNIDLAAVDVDAAIVAAKSQLPPNLPQDPYFKKVNPSSTPILYLAVTSPTATQGELYDYANTFIGQRISIIEGVSQVFVYGSPRAVRAQVDPGMAAYMGLSMGDIARSMAQGNQYQPLGQFDGEHTAATIYDNGALSDAIAYDSLIVAYKNGGPVRLQDLGEVVESLQNDRGYRFYIEQEFEQPTVVLAVQAEPGANAVQVATDINKLLDVLEGQLPGSLQLRMIFDRSESVRESIFDVELTLLIAFILVVFMIYIYLGKARDTIIPAIAMPLSIIATFAVIYSLGYTIDNLSLLALTLAIGFIIDDAIVVLENIVRHIEAGETPYQASITGSAQISFTVISMTLSLVAVFIPLLFMAGLIGKIFQEFSVTLATVTVLSGIISLTITPTLCSRFLPVREKLHTGGIATASARLNSWMLVHYERGLKWALEHRKTMLLIGIMSVLVSAYLFVVLPKDFIPDEDIGFIIVYTESEEGTSSEQMGIYQKQVVDLLKNEPSIMSILSISSSPVYRQGLIFIRLKPYKERPIAEELIQKWNIKLNNIPGVNVFVKNVPLIDLNVGNQVRGSYQYLLQGLHEKQLYHSAEKFITKMRKDPYFVGVSSDLEINTPQINLNLQRDQAHALNIDAQAFESALGLSYSGNRVSRIQTPISQYDVILEVLQKMQRNANSLNFLYVRSTEGVLVPMHAIANWSEGIGPASINHFAQFPAVTITFNVAPNVPLSQAIEHLQEIAENTLAEGINGELKGAAQTFVEAIKSMTLLFIITVLTIYIVLGILYESFIHPLTILSTLPPAIVGALLTLYFTGYTLSLYGYVGIILLIGIVKKNGIMLVDFALENVRTKGESAEKSIYDACIVRFRPIMMTTTAAIMGAIPIALGIGANGASRKPLGYAIIGGMMVSQMITLFLTPVIYLYLERFREGLHKE